MSPIYLLCPHINRQGVAVERLGGGAGLQRALRSSSGCRAVKSDRPHTRTGRREGRRQRWREERAGTMMMGNLHVEPMRHTWCRQQAAVLWGGEGSAGREKIQW